MILDGVDRYRITEPMFECVRIVLNYRGEPYSPEYIQGISGAAFRIAGICPCAPTCSFAMNTESLIKLLGYEWNGSRMCTNKEDALIMVNESLPLLKEDIRNNRPVLAWHAFTSAEWDVVCGFDDKTKELVGYGSYAGFDDYARADENRMADAIDFCPAFGIIRIGRKLTEFDAKHVEMASLIEAARHAHETKSIPCKDKWIMLDGIQCYERWAQDFSTDPMRKRGLGDAYCLGIYRSTHRAASGYLLEIAPKYQKAQNNLVLASENFRQEADILDKCLPLLWWDSPEGPDTDRNKAAGELLSQAAEQYKQGIKNIESALNEIG